MPEPRKAVLCIGDCMLDRRIEGTMSRISPEAPVPVVDRTYITEYPGGAANVAANLAAMGCPTYLIGAVGDDHAGKTLLRLLTESCGVNANLIRVPDHETMVKTRITCGGQQVIRLDEGQRLPEHAANHQVVTALASATIGLPDNVGLVVVADYDKGLMTPAVISGLRKFCAVRGVACFVDARPSKLPDYWGAALITPNAAEALAAAAAAGAVHPALGLPDTDDAIDAAAMHLARTYSFGMVVVTRGSKGATYFGAGSDFTVPLTVATDPQAIYDATGAGDTFMAAMATQLLLGTPLHAAVVWANLAGGLAVREHGTVIVGHGEIEDAVLRQKGWCGKLMSVDAAAAYLVRRLEADEALLVGLANGCFDLLHPGHLQLLRFARERCDLLVAAFNDDASVMQLKGAGRPLVPQQCRGELLSQLADTDVVVMFDGDVEALVRRIKIHVLVKGAEYVETMVPGAEFVARHGGKVLFAPTLPGYSTTILGGQRVDTAAAVG